MAQRARGLHRKPTDRSRGRHRRPGNRSRAIGLTTAPLVAVIPMVTASPAQAATTDTWERLARCESSGRWHINTGNGYYGGVQFSQPTWRDYGGGRFASRADLATKREQITVAERLLDARGWAPWPACRVKLGLGPAERRGTPDHMRAGGAVERRADARASRGKHRRGLGTKIYVVRRGDTLSAIANRKNVPGGWKRLYRINRATIGANAALIRPGQRLSLR